MLNLIWTEIEGGIDWIKNITSYTSSQMKQMVFELISSFRKCIFYIENISIFVSEKYILNLEKREQNETQK